MPFLILNSKFHFKCSFFLHHGHKKRKVKTGRCFFIFLPTLHDSPSFLVLFFTRAHFFYFNHLFSLLFHLFSPLFESLSLHLNHYIYFFKSFFFFSFKLFSRMQPRGYSHFFSKPNIAFWASFPSWLQSHQENLPKKA